MTQAFSSRLTYTSSILPTVIPATRFAYDRGLYQRPGRFSPSVTHDCCFFFRAGGLASIRHGRSLGSAPSIVSVDPELTIARAAKNGGRLVGLGGHRDSVTLELINRNTLNSQPSDAGGASQASMAGAEGDTKEAQSARHAMSNRYALTMMGGVAAETVVNGFGVVSATSFAPAFLQIIKLCSCVMYSTRKVSRSSIDAGVEQLERALHELFERGGDGQYLA